ncbi:recombinase family protein [Klebsiella pasteurii]|nr:recombinase family protein [Klebsiella pasteurii]MCW9586201.1 recombinase family protein [Klebsiella pasteurii]
MTTQQQPTMQAISYVRYSSDLQTDGDSIRRQNSKVTEWLDNHPTYNLVAQFCDEGVSAYKGDNLKKRKKQSGNGNGNLLDLIELAEKGYFEPGAVLLVEALDRLSRQGNRATQKLVDRILSTGLSMVLLQDNPDKIYTEADLEDELTTITIAIKAGMAKDESAKKSARGLQNWQQKRLNASQRIITRSCPAWLEVNEDGTAFLAREPHLTTVRRVFKMRLAGESMVKIAKALNDDQTPNFKGGVGRWNQTTIQQLLTNPATYGEKVISKKATEEVRKNSAPIPDYYTWTNGIGDQESAISLHDFQAVASLATEWGKGRSPSSDDPRLMNLFKSVLVCDHCGASIIQASIKPVKDGYYTYGYYVCSQKRLGRCSEAKALRRDMVERAIIEGLLYKTERLLAGTKADEKALQ